MNENLDKEFVLGRDVTDMFKSDQPAAVSLSIRLPSDVLAALSDLADAQGKTVLEVASEAIRKATIAQ
jgi:hypothetical protein